MHFYQKKDNESIAASTSAVAAAQIMFELATLCEMFFFLLNVAVMN